MGLAIGLSCAILILLYIIDDLKFDHKHLNRNEIYRVIAETSERGEKVFSVRNPIPIAPTIADEFPEVIKYSRYDAIGEFFEIKYEDKVFKDYAAVADSSFFEIFTFNFIEGDPSTVLQNPYDVVLTKKTAVKYFGDNSALNKVLNIRNKDFTVVGVIENFQFNTHIFFDYIIPYRYWFDDVGMPTDRWKMPGPGSTAYLMLEKGSDSKKLQEKIVDLAAKYEPESQFKLSLQAFNKIHLHSSFIRNDGANIAARNIKDIYLFSVLGIFLIIIACINFMNLATARSYSRAREVGVRKVHGGTRKQLINQFLGEAVIHAVLAYIIAMLLVELLLPTFNKLVLKDLSVDYFDLSFLLYLIILVLITAIISGSYPAYILSRFKPEKVLRTYIKGGKKGTVLRKMLVVFQFSISILLIISITTINKQLNYINNQDLGWNQNNLVNVHIGSHFNNNWEVVREELLAYPGIESVSKDASLPVFIADPQANFSWEGKSPDDNIALYWFDCGYDYFKTFKMEIIDGRAFSQNFASDTSNFILNEEAVRAIGFDNPIGKRFSIGPIKGEIIGVVKNFHQTSLHGKIQPLVLSIPPRGGYNLAIRISDRDIAKTVEFITGIWNKYGPGTDIQLDFMDEWVDNLYLKEQREKKIFNVFSGLAIFVSCLGLFGMASFIAEQRSKEIGIRKSIGATTASIIFLLTKEFSKWVLIANVIAWPAGYFVMKHWLQEFEYKTSLSWWIFIQASILALIIANLTVAFKTAKAARQNPSDILRFE